MTFRSSLFMVFVASLAVGCASTSKHILTPLTSSVPQPETIPLLGVEGGAHACPVIFEGESLILTARHVAFRRVILLDGEEIFIPRVWNAEIDGKIASVSSVIQHNYVDMAIVKFEPSPENYFESGDIPSERDVVYWEEYDFRTAKKAYKPRIRSAKVVSLVAGHIFLDKPPTPGASGSCVINENFQVIGIVAFGQGMADSTAISGVVSIENLRE